VTRSDWLAIAEAVHVVRKDAAVGWPPGHADTDARAAHDRKLIHYATLDVIDRVAVALASAIRDRCSRFDERRFLRIVGVRGDR
jgi:hypothetical protein